MSVQTHVDLLGLKAEDAVTGFKGVVTSISFDLYGCIQGWLTPPVDKKTGAAKDGRWFDVTRLKIKNETPVVRQPNFDKGYVAEGKKGAADKGAPA